MLFINNESEEIPRCIVPYWPSSLSKLTLLSSSSSPAGIWVNGIICFLNSILKIIKDISAGFFSDPGLPCWVRSGLVRIDWHTQDTATGSLLCLACFRVHFGLDLLKWMGMLLISYFSMLCLGFNSRSLQSFLEEIITVPTMLQNINSKGLNQQQQ